MADLEARFMALQEKREELREEKREWEKLIAKGQDYGRVFALSPQQQVAVQADRRGYATGLARDGTGVA